jgi:hypothetical protein
VPKNSASAGRRTRRRNMPVSLKPLGFVQGVVSRFLLGITAAIAGATAMELHLHAGEELHVEMSYGAVHTHRRLCILAFLASEEAPPGERDAVRAWLVDQPPAVAAAQMLKSEIELLGKAADTDEAPAGINYDAMPEAHPMERSALFRGLWQWVNHSDSDGEHDVPAVREVAYSLARLASVARKLGGPPEHTEWMYRVADFYLKASDAGLPVEFR